MNNDDIMSAAVIVLSIILILIIFKFRRNIIHKFLKFMCREYVVAYNSEPPSHMSGVSSRRPSATVEFVTEYTHPIEETYELSKVSIGRGDSTEVCIGTHIKTGKLYAIKKIHLNKDIILVAYDRERHSLAGMHHVNITRLYEVYHAQPQHRLHVMELCQGGNLSQLLKKLAGNRISESAAQLYLSQLTSALAYCHNRGVCHRDIKLHNILLEQPFDESRVATANLNIKLSDFCTSINFIDRNGAPMEEIVGDVPNRAPEVFCRSYNERCDIWSLGVVAYTMLCGRPPFEPLQLPYRPSTRTSSLAASIILHRLHFNSEPWEAVSDSAINFVQRCLDPEPVSRYSALAACDDLWVSIAVRAAGSEKIRKQLQSKPKPRREVVNSSLLRALDGVPPFESIEEEGSKGASSSAVKRKVSLCLSRLRKTRKVLRLADPSGMGAGRVGKAQFRSIVGLASSGKASIEAADLLFGLIRSPSPDGEETAQILDVLAAVVDSRVVDVVHLTSVLGSMDREGKGYVSNSDLEYMLQADVERCSADLMGQSGSGRLSRSTSDSSSLLSRGRHYVHGLLDWTKGSMSSREEERDPTVELIRRLHGSPNWSGNGVHSYTDVIFEMCEICSAISIRKGDAASRQEEAFGFVPKSDSVRSMNGVSLAILEDSVRLPYSPKMKRQAEVTSHERASSALSSNKSGTLGSDDIVLLQAPKCWRETSACTDESSEYKSTTY